MAASETYDLVVIGAGPGGYTGAIRAAQLGLKVAVVEKDKTLGGTCLNVGCIPSKALLDSSENFAMVQHDFASHGIQVKNVELDLVAMMARKNKIVKELTSGIEFLFKKNKIAWIKGHASLQKGPQVVVRNGNEQTLLATQNVMIASGSVSAALPSLPYDGKFIVSSTEALSLAQVPKNLVVVGGGAIGLEMGSVWMRLGSHVTVLEYSDKICGPMDAQLSKQLQRILAKQGMEFQLRTNVTSARVRNSQVEVQFESLEDKSQKTLVADVVLVAAGRKPYTEGLGLSDVGVQVDERGRIVVDEQFRTSTAGIFAIGDVIKGPMLAHKAEEEGVAVAEILGSGHGHVNYFTVPGVIYTWPELASVGYTEEELKARNIPYKAGTFPFSANGRAKAIGTTDGQVKILAHEQNDQVLGVHILGPRASDMIAEAVMAMEFGGSSEDIARAFHAHPTLSEVMREAALAVDKRARQS